MATSGESQLPSWRGFTTASLPDVPPWVATLGRLGHTAKGVVYAIMGFLAFKVAIGAGSDLEGAQGAIREIGRQPYGRVLLGLTALGLLSYTAWRWVQAVKDTEGAGDDAKGIFKRSGYAISGVTHLLLGMFAGALALGMAGGSDDSSSARLLESTWGRGVIGIVGAIVFCTGLYFIYDGYRAKFMQKYDLANMSEKFRKIAFHAGRWGLITRGIAVVIIGGFLASSAISGTNDGELSGMEDALAAIAAQAYGKVLIGITGVGLMAYAVHMFLLGWFRKFNIKNS